MITFNEIDTTSLVPGVRTELDLVANASGKGSGPARVMILAHKAITGALAADNEIHDTPFSNWTEARDWFGAGSWGAYLAAVAFLTKGGGIAPIMGAAIADPAGTKAQGKFTAVGSAASTYECKIQIGGLTITFSVPSGSDPAAWDAAVIAAWAVVPEILKPPVAVTENIGVFIQVEANNTGIIGGTAVTTIGLPIAVVSMGGETTQTVTADAVTLGTLVAGVGEPVLTTVLGNLAALQTHCMAYQDCNEGDTTKGLKAVRAHIETKSDGNNGLGSGWLFGWRGTLADGSTLVGNVDTNDAERGIAVWHHASPMPVGALAVATAVTMASQTDRTRSVYDKVINTVAAELISNKPTDTECNTAMRAGLTPLEQDSGGNVIIVRTVAMRTNVQTPLAPMTMTSLDLFREAGNARLKVRFANFKIKETEEECNTPYCTTPNAILAMWKEVAEELARKDILQSVDKVFSTALAEYVDPGQCRLTFDAHIVPNLYQILTRIALVTSV